MHVIPRLRQCRRSIAGAVLLTVTAGILTAAPALATPTKPPPPNAPNVTDQQLQDAASSKQAASSQVGALGAQIAETKSQLRQLEGQAEIAEQKVALRVSQLRASQAKADSAKAAVTVASHSVSAAHLRFVQYLQASYMDGSPDGTTGTLLTADDPNALLQQSTLQQYESQAKLDAIGTYQRATVTKSNAEAAARKAVAERAKATKAAKDAKTEADAAVSAQQDQEASLQASLQTSQAQFAAAQLNLANLTHQRSVHDAYVAYVKEQKRLAAIAAAKAAAEARREAEARAAAEKARKQAEAVAHAKYLERLATEKAAAVAKASNAHDRAVAQQAADHAAHKAKMSSKAAKSGASSSGSSSSSGPSAPSSGGWSYTKGMQAVKRAESALGTPYAWAGGGQSGPSYGVCDSSNGAPNDCYVNGYDCSGLVMYAWGKGWDHYAATQFSQAGSYHPSSGNLKPGDLIFWSMNGSVGGIHHVAIYKGHGQIIEAPYSGGYVQTASLYEYGSFFGATRPLT